MNRRVLRFGAIVGASAVSVLAVSPVFAAAPVSQATAQSLDLSLAGNAIISQIVTSSNDGTSETKNDASTLPSLADLLPDNSLIGVGVAPQEAVSKKDGTSYACAGIAGTGGGIVTVGDSDCDLDGSPLTINLASLDLGNALIGDTSVLGGAINSIPGIGPLLALITGGLNTVVTQISDAINGTPLGEIAIGGSLSAIEASCQADPDAATGEARLVDSSGGSNDTPIGITLPSVGTLPLVNLPANPPPNTKLLTDLDLVTQALVDALTQELETVLGGQLAPVVNGLGLGSLLQTIQDAVIEQVVAALQPLLEPLEQYLLDVTLNKQVSSEGGRKIEVTAIDAQVLPAAQQFIGSSVIGGEIGKVTCGPNMRPTTDTPTDEPTDEPTDGEPEVPTVVDSGLAGNGDDTARNVLVAVAALMALAGSAGLIGYRRSLTK